MEDDLSLKMVSKRIFLNIVSLLIYTAVAISGYISAFRNGFQQVYLCASEVIIATFSVFYAIAYAIGIADEIKETKGKCSDPDISEIKRVIDEVGKVIAVDFDGTLCENKYPDIGDPKNDVIDKLIAERKNGAKLILWTCRGGEYLDNALEWCFEHDIWFDAINENLPEFVELFNNDSRKVRADEYWDDKSVEIRQKGL